MKSLNRNTAKTGLFLFISLIFLFSCRVTLLPEYNAEISKNIENTAKLVDKFYLLMSETTSEENSGRSYDRFAEMYVEIEVEINSLLNQNKIRPLNENSTRICEITLELWQKYKEEHKTDNTLSNGLIRLNRKVFADLFFAMQVAEEGNKLVNNPPE
ncbi:MAG TPA: hypothetical protein ENN90_08100 [Mariniphaga anaerophila]|uniref:Imelysin n=1 Tax=Mariniphaga anaerophila TaxID=1484053 RepID=A0A831LHD6_9BACT|nr:hypothetical protein [Mariniphaga anaerophila]